MKNILAVLLLLPIIASAEPPKVLTNALDKYVVEGKSSFLPELVKGSAIEGDKNVLAQENMIGQIESFYGKIESWEILDTCEFTQRFRTTYFIIYYEAGPVFGFLNSFINMNKDEVAVRFQFHTEPVQILPYWPIQISKICEDM